MNNREEQVIKHENVGERHGLALPIELEEGAPPYLAKAAMAVLSGLILLLLVWANIAHVREISAATGAIAPYGSTREAAHLEGGIVDDVLVTIGGKVVEGQPLVQMRVENSGGEFSRLSARHAGLEIRAERLSAQAQEREPNFESVKQSWPDIVDEQLTVFNAAVKQHAAARETAAAKEISAAYEVKKAEAEYTAESELLEYANEQLAIQEELIGDGFTSKQSYLQAKAAVSTAKASAAAAESRLEQARRAHRAALAEKDGVEADYQNRIAEERASVLNELAEIEEPMLSLKDRAERLTVRAPVAGIVNDLMVHGRGDVVPPGGVIAEITPTDAKLMAEVRIDPKDIGHIAIGLETDITVTTFDPNRYGKISGVVAYVSADSFTDERTGDPYYTAYVELSEETIGKGAKMRKLAPGMQVRAEIVTQQRTLMQYALKPVARSLDQAFTER